MNTVETIQEVILDNPLYSKKNIKGSIRKTTLSQLKPLNFYCDKCKSIQTFELKKIDNESISKFENCNKIYPYYTSIGNHSHMFEYGCLKCNQYKVRYILSFSEKMKRLKAGGQEVSNTDIQKIGQLPTFEEEVDNELKNWFKKNDYDLFQKGIRSESNGFGIGAFSYFRRIVENNIEDILERIGENSDSDDLKEAIKSAQKQNTATERLNIVKDHVPDSLKPGGQNIIKILYKALSNGLHNLSDEACLSKATDIKTCLTFLIKKITRETQEQKEFLEALKGLQDNTKDKR